MTARSTVPSSARPVGSHFAGQVPSTQHCFPDSPLSSALHRTASWAVEAYQRQPATNLPCMPLTRLYICICVFLRPREFNAKVQSGFFPKFQATVSGVCRTHRMPFPIGASSKSDRPYQRCSGALLSRVAVVLCVLRWRELNVKTQCGVFPEFDGTRMTVHALPLPTPVAALCTVAPPPRRHRAVDSRRRRACRTAPMAYTTAEPHLPCVGAAHI